MTQNTRRFSILFGLFALVLTVAGVVYAQGRHGEMMGGMRSMMQDCPMMESMQQGPAAALQHAQELGLTADQAQRIEALQKGSRPGHMQMMGQMRAIHQEIAKVTEGERFDEAAARAAFDRMGNVHTEMGIAMLRARHQVQQILTVEQREKLSKVGGGMMGMQGMMMGATDMKDCPMMRGTMGGGMSGMHKRHSGS